MGCLPQSVPLPWSRMYIADRPGMITVQTYVSSVCRDRPQGTSVSGAAPYVRRDDGQWRTQTSSLVGDGGAEHPGEHAAQLAESRDQPRRAAPWKPYGRTGKNVCRTP
jgi:hypothetical protein